MVQRGKRRTGSVTSRSLAWSLAWSVGFLSLVVACDKAPEKVAQDESSKTSQSLAVDEILRRCQEAYRACDTYGDTGSVRSSVSNGDESQHSDGRFVTLLRRPGEFRSDYTGKRGSENIAYSIWRSGNGTVKTRRNGVMQDGATLAGELTGANGLCGGAPCLIARLLFPEYSLVGLDLLGLEDHQRGEDERVGGTVCFRVEAAQDMSHIRWPGLEDFPKTMRVTLWIDREAFLIRRVRTEAVSSTIRMETTFELLPRVNKKIADQELELK